MVKSAFFSKLIESGQFNVEDSGHAMLFGEYLLMVPPSVMLKLQMDLEKMVGKKRSQKLLSDLGEYQISQALERYVKRFSIKKIDKRKILDFEKNILNILGWGDFSLNDISFRRLSLYTCRQLSGQDPEDRSGYRPEGCRAHRGRIACKEHRPYRIRYKICYFGWQVYL